MDSIGEIQTPSPRCHTACASRKSTQSVFLFGGTDQEQNFGDFWVFNGPQYQGRMVWAKLPIVGFPPSPRYGHKLLSIEKGNTLVVLGGCTVSPTVEFDGSRLHLETPINQMTAEYQDLLDKKFASMKRRADGLSEVDHKQAEDALKASWKNQRAMNYYTKKHSVHTNPLIDIYYYNTNLDAWEERKFPRITGKVPASRMYFGAEAIGNFIFLVGGCYPTSLFTKPIEVEKTEICILDLKTHVWSRPLPINSDAYFRQTMLIAEGDIIRAQNKVKNEIYEGHAVGKPCMIYFAFSSVTVSLLTQAHQAG